MEPSRQIERFPWGTVDEAQVPILLTTGIHPYADHLPWRWQ